MLLSASSTLRFLASRQKGPGEYLETGEDEPTMEALRWAAEISAILSGEPPTPGPFIDQCLRPGGTFAITAGEAEPSRNAGYYAVRALVLSGRRDEIPPGLVHWFLEELSTADRPARTDIDEMFYVLRALEQLDALRLLSTDVSGALIAFLKSCRNADGGYGGVPGQPSDTEHTYCAVCSLALLGRPLDAAESSATARWLTARFATPSGLATLTATDDTPSLACSYWGFRAGEVLDSVVWTDRLGPAVESLGRLDGGYGMRSQPTLWESYCAMRIISRLLTASGAGR